MSNPTIESSHEPPVKMEVLGELPKINDLKAQLQDKDTTICKLKEIIKSMREKTKEGNVNSDKCEIATINVELENRKGIVDLAAQIPSATTIVPDMFKLDLEPLAPRLLRNREAHIDYLSEKKVVVTPKNNVKKVRFAKPLTSSSNIKQPTCNKKNDRISQTPSRNIKNKVEAQPRKVNKNNHVVEPICDVDVKYSLLNMNFELLCATCKKSMFDGVHDMCLLDFVDNVNSRAKSAKKHKKQNIWKPTSHIFTDVGLKWKPTGKTFVGSSKRAKIIESKNANHSEPNHTWGSNATDIPSSFSLVMTGCPDCSLIANIMGYSDYQLGNVTISRVYYVEGLGHDLFSIGQFCDADVEVAFRKNTCFIRNLEGVDLLSGSRDINLYTISLDDMLKTSPICLLSKASKTKSWLWHRLLSHLNFGTLNKLAKDGLARGILRLK
ncbi:integrase, catalytic region, zinc finger, CCHC-type containing protein [Tanacetum coccineum]